MVTVSGIKMGVNAVDSDGNRLIHWAHSFESCFATFCMTIISKPTWINRRVGCAYTIVDRPLSIVPLSILMGTLLWKFSASESFGRTFISLSRIKVLDAICTMEMVADASLEQVRY